jgi:nitrogen PTS system EIIA component
MVRLMSYIRRKAILDIESENHDEILTTLIDNALENYPDETRKRVFEEIIEKSHKKEINMGKGFALSHARIEGVQDIHVSIGLLPKKILYFKGEPVRVVFCIVIPVDKSRIYLSMMARFTRMLSQPDAGDVFVSGNHDEIIEYIERFDR